MPNYKNGKIYKIVCNTTGKVYIGSTTVLLCKRLACHVNDYKRGKCITSKEILDGGNYSIVLIENVECDTKEQLLKRERHYIESITCVNKRCPIISVEEAKEKSKEYYENNKELLLEQKKEYKQLNKEAISEQRKEYHNKNKAKIAQCKKEWYEANKDNVKEYHNKNKEKINEQQRERRLKKKQEIERAINELNIVIEQVPV